MIDPGDRGDLVFLRALGIAPADKVKDSVGDRMSLALFSELDLDFGEDGTFSSCCCDVLLTPADERDDTELCERANESDWLRPRFVAKRGVDISSEYSVRGAVFLIGRFGDRGLTISSRLCCPSFRAVIPNNGSGGPLRARLGGEGEI